MTEQNQDDEDLGLLPWHASGQEQSPLIVGLGASAGGLEALTQVLENAPGLTGMAFVVVQHLSADYKSLMPELLARHTEMEVIHARHGVVPAPDTVYVIEPDTVLTFKGGRLHVQPAHRIQGKLFLPINDFFTTLAEERRADCAVVVLSGTGSDGASGLRAAKACGAVTVCQVPESARFDGMPRAAMSTGAVDLVLTPDHVIPQLMQMRQEGTARYFSASSGHGELVISRILNALRTHTNIDFNHYKPATIVRRVERRMRELNLDDAREYADRLYQDPDEAVELRHDLLIGVTRFLRDEGAIDALRTIAIPRLVSKAETTTLRLWVAGCSTGEEAYSVAMLLQEALDTLPEHKGFKLFATDVDPAAIERASSGEFGQELLDQLPERLRDRFFTRRGDTYVVNKSLREKLLFSKHDVIQDPPFSQLDLISCRNLLIYFKPGVQERVMRLVSAALKDGGLLWLGASETIGDRVDQFETLDSRWRIYSARPNRKRSAVIPLSGRAAQSSDAMRRIKKDDIRPLLEALQEAYVPPCLVLDTNFRLLYRFGELDTLLKLPTGPVSLDIRDLLPDDLSVLITALLARARDGGDVVYRELTVITDQGPRRFDMRARSVTLAEHGPLIALFFEGLREVQQDTLLLSPEGVGNEARDRMELLERELRQTRESLQATIEELESSNEELQATNEELIAANEELQSTNEELQSVNEELHTVNAEYSEKVNELTLLNEDMDQLFASVDVGILLLDEKLIIRRFNASATEHFNVLPQDVGRPLMHLAHRLCYANLLEDCQQAMRNTGLPIWRRVSTHDGRQVQVQIRGHEGSHQPANNSNRSIVITVTDTTMVEGTQQQLSRLAVAIEHSALMIAVVDSDDQIVHANGAFATGVSRELNSLKGMTLTQLVHPSERDRTREALARTRAGTRWRGVMRTVKAGQDHFDLVRFVPATTTDASVIRISETLDERFVPYDKDRGPDEPTPLGPICYCLWCSLDNQRVVDSRVFDLLELTDESEFDLARPERFTPPEDAAILRELVKSRDTRGTRGYCFPVLKAVPARLVQIRLWPVPTRQDPERLLVELAEVPRSTHGFRA